MALTDAQQAWVVRVLFDGEQGWDQDPSDLAMLKFEAQSVRSNTRVSYEDFEKVRKLFVQLSVMVEDAADIGSLLKLSELDTGGDGSPVGQVQRVAYADFAALSGLFQKALAGVTAVAPGASLSKLAQLGAGTPEGSSAQPLATRAQFVAIEQGLKDAGRASTIELNNLLALADLRRES